MENRNQSNGKVNLYQVVTDRILQLLETQILTWNKPWVAVTSDGKRAHNALSGRVYSGLNQILLTIHQVLYNYSLNGWMTFEQVHKTGGIVRAGEKSSAVFFHKDIYYDKFGKRYESKQLELMTGEEQERLNLKKYSVLLYYNVFNLVQTSGLPPSYYHLEEQPKLTVVEKDDRAENLIAQSNARILHMVTDKACYNYLNDVIFLPERTQFNGTEEYYETVLHELGHWTGHKSRLDRSLKNVFGSEDYAKEELIAELCSAFLCAELGFSKVITNNAAYIQDWIKVLQNDPRYFLKAVWEAEMAAEFIYTCVKANESAVSKDES